jgi:hypothetical protein
MISVSKYIAVISALAGAQQALNAPVVPLQILKEVVSPNGRRELFLLEQLRSRLSLSEKRL